MGGRSRPTERMHEPVKLKDLKIYLGPSRRKALSALGIENMNDLFFYTNRGFSRNVPLDVNDCVVSSLCGAFGYNPSKRNLLKIREFAGVHLTDDFIKKRNSAPYLADVRDSIIELRAGYGLRNPCEEL